MLSLSITSFNVIPPSVIVSIRCPSCRQQGTFEPIVLPGQNPAQDIYLTDQNIHIGQRRCPNPACRGHLLFAYDPNRDKVLMSYPAERIDFDATNLPPGVLSALEEAITCHANQSFVAAAIMVRKTLEELCRDRSAQGASLKDRIKALGTKVVLPQELLDKVWKKAYDASNRVVSSSNPIPNPNTATTLWVYDDDGKATADSTTGRPAGTLGVPTVFVTDPLGAHTLTKSDLLGRKTSEQAGDNAQPNPITWLSATAYEYDAAGSVTKVTDPTGVWTRSEYNPFSELKKTTARTGTGGAEEDAIYVYDDAGRLDTVTDARGKVTEYGYDAEGRITSVLPPGLLAGETAWVLAYDDAGELVRTTDPNSRVRDVTFDSLGRASTYTETRAAGYTCPRSGTNVCTTTSHFNGFSELTSVDDPRNIALYFVYDNLGRRIQRCQVCTGQTVDSETYEYDPAGNMTKAINASATVEMTYDDAGRIDVVTQGSSVTDHTYDAGGFKGLLTSRADPAGTTTFSYDAYGRLGSLTDPLTNTATAYGYDGAGRVTSRIDPAQITTTRVYDAPYTGRVLTETVTDSAQATLASFTWGYDEVGNVTSADQTIGTNADNGAWAYTYDDMNRLQTATLNSNPTTTYGYDGAGNRTSVQVGAGAAVTTTYDTAGLPVSSSDTTTYSHDAAGNMTSVAGPTRNWTLTYDSWGRIASATGQPQITYVHDALDRLFRKNRTGVQTTYSYVGLSEDPVREATQGGTTTFFAWSGGGPIAQKQGSAVRVYEQNLHGDAAMLATPAGGIAATQAYKPFGERGAGNMSGSLLSFQSDMTDGDTGFVDMGARLYDPVLGRFTSRDPLFGEAKTPLSLNRYAYGWDNPVSNGDPNGLYCINYGEAVRCNDSTSASDKPTKSSYHPSSSYSQGSSPSYGSSASASAKPAPPPVPAVPRPFWIEVNAPPQRVIDYARVSRTVDINTDPRFDGHWANVLAAMQAIDRLAEADGAGQVLTSSLSIRGSAVARLGVEFREGGPRLRYGIGLGAGLIISREKYPEASRVTAGFGTLCIIVCLGYAKRDYIKDGRLWRSESGWGFQGWGLGIDIASIEGDTIGGE